MEKVKSFFFSNTNNRQTVTKNTFWLFSSEAISRLLKMVLIIYAARILGVNGWGVFSYALSIGSLLMIFADIGISGLITREIIQKKEDYRTFISSALFIKIIILIICTLCVIIIGPHISNIHEAKVLLPVIALILFFDSMRELGLAINRAYEKMEWEMVVKIIMSVITIVVGIILLKIRPVPISVTIAYAIGGATGFLVIFIIIRKEVRKLLSRINKQSCKLVLETTMPFALLALVGVIMGNTDIFMLGIWKDSTEIGLYSSAQRIQQFIIMIPSMFATATFPLISRLVEDREKFRDIFEKIISSIMIIGIPMATGGLILSSQIIHLVFGPEYFGAIPILQIFMFILLISFPLIFISNAIFAYNRQKDLIVAYLSGIVINIIINYLLIPRFGAVGAAVATFASTTIVVVVIWIKMKKINNFKILKGLKKSIISTLIMAISILLLKYVGLHVVLNIIISSLIYLGSLMILKEPILKEVRNFYK